MDTPADRPTVLTSNNKEERWDIFARAGNGEFVLLWLDVGRHPNSPWRYGVSYPKEKQSELKL